MTIKYNMNHWVTTPCFAVVIAHGRTEYTLADFLRRRYRLNIRVLGHNRGRSSIQVDGLSNWINNHSRVKTHQSINRLCGFNSKKQWKHFHIYTIMDVGHVHDRSKKYNYIHGHVSPRIKDDIVRKHIITIYNNKDIEDTFNYGDLKDIDRRNKSVSHYRRVFEGQLGTKDQLKSFTNKIKKDSNTNLERFLNNCINHMIDFNK